MDIRVLRYIRYASIGLIALLVFASLAVGLGWLQSGQRQSATLSGDGPKIAAFNLIDQKNTQVSEKDIVGKPAVLFFGFGYCPDVCPTTLADLTGWLGRLGSDADRLGVFFVTVDPERDTPDELAKYLSSFDSRIRGLTGAPDQIAALGKSLGVYYAKVQTGNGSYTMDHTSSMFLLDAQGRIVGTIPYGENKDEALAKLRQLAAL